MEGSNSSNSKGNNTLPSAGDTATGPGGISRSGSRKKYRQNSANTPMGAAYHGPTSQKTMAPAAHSASAYWLPVYTIVKPLFSHGGGSFCGLETGSTWDSRDAVQRRGAENAEEAQRTHFEGGWRVHSRAWGGSGDRKSVV